MKTRWKAPRMKGWLNHEQSMRLLKKKDPATYARLQNPGPRTCVAWHSIDLRGKAKLTQAGLASKAGLSRRSIQYLEDITSKYNPTLDVLEKVAKALKVEVKDLLSKMDLTKGV